MSFQILTPNCTVIFTVAALLSAYFVVGHFHMVMGVAAMFGIFGGTYFWFPKMAGRMMNETFGKIHFWLSFVGTYCIFNAIPSI
jgi:cytochrome c oxidase subunit I